MQKPPPGTGRTRVSYPRGSDEFTRVLALTDGAENTIGPVSGLWEAAAPSSRSRGFMARGQGFPLLPEPNA